MCGIGGIVNRAGVVNRDTIFAMGKVLTHRGPDETSFHIENAAGFVHTRLSIIDVRGGKQPILNEDKNLLIIFNGEIYNYRKIRSQLIAKGHIFRTNSDTEVILHLYEDYGVECLSRLRGMFALAIWDKRKRELFIARDRLGKKPLYYSNSGNEIVFASELKALLLADNVKREVN